MVIKDNFLDKLHLEVKADNFAAIADQRMVQRPGLVRPALTSRDIALADILGALRAPDLRDDQHLIVSLLRMPRTVVAILAGIAARRRKA